MATLLFVQQFVQAYNKEYIKALHNWPFVRGIHWWLVDSPYKGIWTAFPYRKIIMEIDTVTCSETLVCLLNLSPPSAAYMHQWTGSALVQVMGCCLFGAKPLPEPVLAYSQLDYREQISVKFESEFYHFHSRKCIWNCRLPIWRPFCPGGDELNGSTELLLLDWFNVVGHCISDALWFHHVSQRSPK